MRVFVILMSLFVVAAFAGSSMAVPPGQTVEFAGGAMGKVAFDGKMHADKGKKCNDCHPAIFQMKKGTAKITQPMHNEGKQFCFTCHNGNPVFKPEGNCQKCHKKEAAAGEQPKTEPAK
ncbi:MAG TPA: c(7)-type cytochrome triheme domain-containing protein [Thermodesulfovibrionia bacterium]|nr:c(7)-type cytochrome triheme domain-containing protein [Thermodesulfovibrionia bacterium]